jgi:hypothetical protein
LSALQGNKYMYKNKNIDIITVPKTGHPNHIKNMRHTFTNIMQSYTKHNDLEWFNTHTYGLHFPDKNKSIKNV